MGISVDDYKKMKARLVKSAKPSKYGNIKCEWNGKKFDSKKEMQRAQYLHSLLIQGKIQELEYQPRFPFVMDGEKMFTYVGDFRYLQRGEYVVEDVKGMKTAVYKLKKKLIEKQYNIKIIEI